MFTICALLITSGGSVLAASFPETSNEPFNVNCMADLDISKETYNLVEQYVKIEDNQYVLDLHKNARKAIDEQELSVIEQSIHEVNRSIETINNHFGFEKIDLNVSNELVISDEELAQNFKTSGITLPDEGNEPVKSAKATGVTKIKFYLWGVDIYLSSTALKFIYGATAAGATFAAAVCLTYGLIAAGFAYAIAGGVAGVATSTQKNGYIFRVKLPLKYSGRFMQ